MSEKILEKYLPFTKKLPDWGEKLILFLMFIIFYLIVKSVVYFVFGLAGIDLEKIIVSAFEKL
ncbi:MAG: hypothetical protein NUV57_06320 [archaeon]|nr:hypothetical protein [archaeon]